MTAKTGIGMAHERLRGRHVVIVDDDESLLRVLATGLEHAGCIVTAFGRFDDAKRYLAATTPEILLTDVRLGGSNGLHLVVMSKLRATSRMRSGPMGSMRKYENSAGACTGMRFGKTCPKRT